MASQPKKQVDPTGNEGRRGPKAVLKPGAGVRLQGKAADDLKSFPGLAGTPP
jgi:hypothetical protein